MEPTAFVLLITGITVIFLLLMQAQYVFYILCICVNIAHKPHKTADDGIFL